jgi:hypothetical protein
VPPLIEHQPGQFAACHFAGDPIPATTSLTSDASSAS